MSGAPRRFARTGIFCLACALAASALAQSGSRLPSLSDAVRLVRARVRETTSAPLPDDQGLRQYLRGLMDARQKSDAAAGPAYAGLPTSIPADWPQTQGFVPFKGIPGDFLVAEVNGHEIAFEDGAVAPGLALSQVVDQEEAALLPSGRTIRRELVRLRYRGRNWSYEIWHYPAGSQVIHLITDHASGKIIELRLLQKRPDGPRGENGPWSFGIYRPRPGQNPAELYLYAPKNEKSPESEEFALPGGGKFRWTHLPPSSCRSCHSSMGDGWYQYPDDSRAGPCGFVPANPSLLGDWARRYRQSRGCSPFSGPS
ncbi:MAG TPA: hypothetical protein VNH15_08650 [Elusimicrobiota bacterium]|nr:hypothetical protein [Elusimicrobiota bacterium]